MSDLELISNFDENLASNDPELKEILDRFIKTQVLRECSLDDESCMLVILSCLIANQSLKLYESTLNVAIDLKVSPISIKEALYQAIPYIGIAKTYDFLEITNKVFIENGIELPLPSQATTTSENRLETGYNIQVNNFTKEFIDNNIDNTPSGQKHIWDFISSFAFGDFYSRNGLTEGVRELVSFTYILCLRGCENQLRIHTKGNIAVGNTKEDLISVITVLVPYIGFPRVHNALAIVNEICD